MKLQASCVRSGLLADFQKEGHDLEEKREQKAAVAAGARFEVILTPIAASTLHVVQEYTAENPPTTELSRSSHPF